MKKSNIIILDILLLLATIDSFILTLPSPFCGMVGPATPVTFSCKVMSTLYFPLLIADLIIALFLISDIWRTSLSNPRALGKRGIIIITLILVLSFAALSTLYIS